jgi:hypothetical protein
VTMYMIFLRIFGELIYVIGLAGCF